METLSDIDKFRPVNDWVLVRVDEEAPRASSLIELPDNAVQPLRTGTVIKTGPGRLYVDGVYIGIDLRPGDRVVFFAAVMDTKQGKTLLHSLPEGHTLLREGDALFVIEEGNPTVEV